ncbi:MAG: GNAT family N-acetyltransferase [Bdellovibrionaceae bacterium]|nr:GNAT family N-acetyltransferase [Pseudobdellovibrionaceae bacterium]
MSARTEVRSLTVSETLSLRQKVLRPFAVPADCQNPEDADPLGFHLGVFHAGRLACVGSFHTQSHPELPAGFPFRLRGMATDEKYRGRGFGGLLLRHGVEVLRAKRCDLLWFKARIKAFPFYESMGFVYHGDLFEMPRIGPHKVMYKHLNPR